MLVLIGKWPGSAPGPPWRRRSRRTSWAGEDYVGRLLPAVAVTCAFRTASVLEPAHVRRCAVVAVRDTGDDASAIDGRRIRAQVVVGVGRIDKAGVACAAVR